MENPPVTVCMAQGSAVNVAEGPTVTVAESPTLIAESLTVAVVEGPTIAVADRPTVTVAECSTVTVAKPPTIAVAESPSVTAEGPTVAGAESPSVTAESPTVTVVKRSTVAVEESPSVTAKGPTVAVAESPSIAAKGPTVAVVKRSTVAVEEGPAVAVAKRPTAAVGESPTVTAEGPTVAVAESHRIIHLDEYVVTCSKANRLGAGGFGTVWKGRHKINTEVEVAIKVLDKRKCAGRLIQRESDFARMLSSHEHRNVIKFFTVDNQERFMYLVLELCTMNLDKLFKIAESKVLFAKSVSYMRDMSAGVEHLHKLHIVHRDLKPANILEKEGCLKIADLGLARDIPETSSTLPSVTGGVGTRGWLAPEVYLSGRRAYHLPVDVFALGLMFVSMLVHEVGKSLMPHYEADLSLGDWMRAVGSAGYPVRIPDLGVPIGDDEWVKKALDVITEMLCFTPADRIRIANVCERLKEIDDGMTQEPEDNRPSEPNPPTPEPQSAAANAAPSDSAQREDEDTDVTAALLSGTASEATTVAATPPPIKTVEATPSVKYVAATDSAESTCIMPDLIDSTASTSVVNVPQATTPSDRHKRLRTIMCGLLVTCIVVAALISTILLLPAAAPSDPPPASTSTVSFPPTTPAPDPYPSEVSLFNGELEPQRKLSTPGWMIGLLADGKLAVVSNDASPGTASSFVRLSVAPVDNLHEAHHFLDVPHYGPYAGWEILHACGLADGRVAVTSVWDPFVDLYDNSGKHINRTVLPPGAGKPGCSPAYVLVPLWRQPRLCLVDWDGELRQTLGTDELGLSADADFGGVSSIWDGQFSAWRGYNDLTVHTFKITEGDDTDQ